MSNGASRRSPASFVFDWFLVLTTITISLALLNVNPDSHHFSVVDLSISYAHRGKAKVPLWLLIVLSVVTPILIISIISLQSITPTPQLKYRNLNTSLLGLGISLASISIILNVKNLVGKPRPDFLSICQPDLDKIKAHASRGFAQDVSPLWVMVDRSVCRQGDHARVNEALRSFPCGYAAVAFAGLVYLSLWLSRHFKVNLLAPRSSKPRTFGRSEESEDAQPMLPEGSAEASPSPNRHSPLPVYFLFLPYLPFGLAVFIAGTRYFDFRNHGIDVFAGAGAGTVFAYIGWRWCH